MFSKFNLYVFFTVLILSFGLFNFHAYSEDWDSFSYDTRKDTRPKVDLSLPPHAPPIYKQARNLDLLGDSNPRAHISGSYISWLGIQLHPSCIQYAKQEGIKDVEMKFESWVGSALNDVINGCSVNYPEIRPYINEWISQARRTVITCTQNNPKMKSVWAVNCTNKLSVLSSLHRHEKFGLGHSGLLWDSQHNMHRSVVIFPVRSLKLFLSENATPFWKTRFNETFIHELFHSTSANNRNDHNSIQKVIERKDNMCKENALDDRIEIISGLCAGSGKTKKNKLSSKNFIFTNDMTTRIYNRVSKCGMERGCINTFNSSIRNPFNRIYINSTPLKDKNAINLCKRIYSDALRADLMYKLKQLEASFKTSVSSERCFTK